MIDPFLLLFHARLGVRRVAWVPMWLGVCLLFCSQQSLHSAPLDYSRANWPQFEMLPADIVHVSSEILTSYTIRTLRVKSVGNIELVADMLHLFGESFLHTSKESAPVDSIRIDHGSTQGTFCPCVCDNLNDSLVMHTNAESGLFWLTGSGSTAIPSDEYQGTVFLDTVTSHVNDRFRMSLRFDPPLESQYGVRGYRLTLRIDKNALYPWGAYSAVDGAMLSMYWGGDNIVIESSDVGMPVATKGDTLLWLELEGLVTGMAENRVELMQVALKRGRVGTVQFTDGLVHLEGCDIGSSTLVQAKASIATILPNPVNGTATIEYRATVGSVPLLRLLDMTGCERLAIDLATGNGLPQQAAVDVDGIPDGFYLLQLRVGADVATVPVMISH